ncbi:MAG: anhydro-N-acetylmuramic acid kinase [Pedobacter sp.]|nr:MAG: anhydro-N-acetylmuramic acid kinase [Pedobacter sp.]
MKAQIEKLFNLSLAKKRRIIGLMSGTSMDGLDIVLCKMEGVGLSTKVEVENFKTIPYEVDFKNTLKTIFANPEANLEDVTLLNAWIARKHAGLVLDTLSDWGIKAKEIDLIASHGQTIFHSPANQHLMADFPNATLQIGDGDHLAVLTDIITLSDFRQKHIAAGGEGAPLAVYGDYLLFSEKAENRILLNIGGISNFTYLPGNLQANEVFSTDVGPGNTLMDQYVFKYFNGLAFDKDAKIAKTGKPDFNLLEELLNFEFFNRPIPKTTGPEVFNIAYLKRAQERSNTQNLKPEDVLCTLCHFTAEAIKMAIESISSLKLAINSNERFECVVYASGGGIHNPLLMELLQSKLQQIKLVDFKNLGILPDAKEAVLFAVLANETIAGEGTLFENNQGVPSVCMGKISLPK